MPRLRIAIFPLVLGAGLWALPTGDRPDPAPLPTAADSLNDGPHVYWEDDQHAVVFYLCSDTVPAVRYEGRGTIGFRGLCADTATSYLVSTAPPTPARDVWENVPRILAIGDVHGEYDHLVMFLQRAGVIDSTGAWAWGTGHLVVLGDIVDRGAQVTECLWLLHRLEQEAALAGGRVHVLLGNHEMMVMRGDLRYPHERYKSGIVRYLGIRYPDLFGPEMELGRWLRSKPVALKLNDLLFVHGGIAPEIAARGLDIATINRVFRESLDRSSIALLFSDVPGLLLGNTGPLWYRGYLTPGVDYAPSSPVVYPPATAAQLDSVLAFYGTKAVVVGHTTMSQVMRLREGRVYATNVSPDMLGSFQGLLWEDGEFQMVTGLGTLMPLP